MAPRTKKTKELLKKCEDYIEECGLVDDKLKMPSVAGLALYLGISRSILNEWRSDEKERGDKDCPISDTLSIIKGEQHELLINNGLMGTFSPAIAKLMLHNHGYSDRVETDNTHKLPEGINVNFIGSTEKKPDESK